jgi:hypothetical protein
MSAVANPEDHQHRSDMSMSDQLSIDLPAIDPALPPTLGGFLDELAARFGPREAVALVDTFHGNQRISWTYVELRRQARSIAKALIAAGGTNSINSLLCPILACC